MSGAMKDSNLCFRVPVLKLKRGKKDRLNGNFFNITKYKMCTGLTLYYRPLSENMLI